MTNELGCRERFVKKAGPGAKTWTARLVDGGVSPQSAARILSVSHPAARIVTFPSTGMIEPGVSKFGGMPDVPPAFAWPRHRDAPLAFLAQIRISELPVDVRISLALPADGLISFFYDLADFPWGHEGDKDRGSSRLALFTNLDELAPRAAPADLDDEWVTPEARVRFVEELTLPAYGSPAFEALAPDATTRAAYAHQPEAVDDVPHHYVGGHATPVQRALETEVALNMRGVPTAGGHVHASALAAAAPDASTLRLVLQLDEDLFAPFLADAGGRLYVWMQPADVQAQRFDRAWCLFQRA